jgi:hypothetical protein
LLVSWVLVSAASAAPVRNIDTQEKQIRTNRIKIPRFPPAQFIANPPHPTMVRKNAIIGRNGMTRGKDRNPRSFWRDGTAQKDLASIN